MNVIKGVLAISGMCLVVLMAAGAAFCATPAPATLKEGELIDLERCLQLGLQRHPSLAAAARGIDAVLGRIGQAKAGYLPQLHWSSSAQRVDPYYAPEGRTGTGGDIYNNYNTSLNLSQTLYDFQKTATQVKIQELYADSSREDLAWARLQVILGVRQAYYGLLKAQKQQEVAVETVEQFRRHLELARALYEAGTKSRIDVTKAEVDLSNARLNLVKAENALKLAVANLNNAMGYPDAPSYTVKEDTPTVAEERVFAEALKTAYEKRPDLRSAITKRAAAEQAVQLAKTGYYPTVTGSAGVGYGGQSFPIDRGWNVAATVSVPLFSGLSTKYQVEEAVANLGVARANEETLRQAIHLEVRQAQLNVNEARERVSMTEVAVRQALENRDLANGRYAAGLGNAIEVADAIGAVNNAKLNYWSAFYDLQAAQAALEKAMGLP
ncbi:MAG: TolC family protein [Syntrophales bacterium]|nr:TolC family protein [Syntrophales bacterium]